MNKDINISQDYKLNILGSDNTVQEVSRVRRPLLTWPPLTSRLLGKTESELQDPGHWNRNQHS